MFHIIAGYYIFASAISVNKFILNTLSPLFFVGIRTLASGLLMGIFTFFIARKFSFSDLKRDLPRLLLISFFTTFLSSALKAYSLKHMISSKQTLIGSLDPFVAALFAFFLFGERLTRLQIVGMFVSFSGIVFLLVATAPFEEVASSWGIVSLPEIAAFASMVVNRYGWILAQGLLRTKRYTPLEFNSINMILAGILGLSAAYLLGMCDFCTMPPTGEFWIVFSYTVIIGNIAGYTIYAKFLKDYSVTLLSLCGLSLPLFVHLLGPFILHEPLSPVFFVALAIVFTGMFIFTRQHTKKSSATKPDVVS